MLCLCFINGNCIQLFLYLKEDYLVSNCKAIKMSAMNQKMNECGKVLNYTESCSGCK